MEKAREPDCIIINKENKNPDFQSNRNLRECMDLLKGQRLVRKKPKEITSRGNGGYLGRCGKSKKDSTLFNIHQNPLKDSSNLEEDELKEGTRKAPKAITQRSPPKNHFNEIDAVMRDAKAGEKEKAQM